MEKPYVISAELDLIDLPFIKNNQIDAFRQSLDDDLRIAGKNTLWVPAATLRRGLNQRIAATNLPVVSLDDRYVTSADGKIGLSRGIDEQLNDAGYVPRVGYDDLSKQLDAVATLGREVALADDVVYSGEMIAWLADELQQRDVAVRAVIAGIAIREGIEKLETYAIDVDAVTSFDDVEDELCERDFAVVPGSGRRIANLGANALYFCTRFGKPSQWASIPTENSPQFAQASYLRSAELLEPNTPLRTIGSFYGIDDTDDTARSLTTIANQLERTI